MTTDPLKTNVWMVGGGIASMAAAAFMIRDAGVPGENGLKALESAFR